MKSQWAVTLLILALLIISSPAWGEEKTTLTSDTLEYQQDEARHLAEGNVILKRGPMQLRANRLWFDNQSKQFQGIGNVAFTEGGNTIFASEIDYDLLAEKGVLLDGRLFLKAENYTLTGKKIERLALGKIALHEAFFTACDCDQYPDELPDWHIKAASLKLTVENYLTAKDLFFYAKGVPILYLPYFIYPVKTTRQTGLLIPNVGASSTQGLRYNQDFFWAVSSNQDATFSLDYRGKKGVGTGIEYRYVLSTESRGMLQAERFHDIEKNSDKVALRTRLKQQLSKRMRLSLNAQYISVNDYYSELSDFTAERALQKTESNAALTYRGDESFGYLLARYTQDLTGTSTTLQRLPEAGWMLTGHKMGILFLDINTTYTRFFRETDFVWERTNLAPRLSLPIRVSSAITATPWAEYRGINYSRTVLSNASLFRNIVGTGIDLHSERGGTMGKTPIRFSNNLTYEEINVDDNLDIPQADDIDKIHHRRSMTLSLNPRSLFTSLRLTQTYDFVTSPSSPNHLSDLRTEWSLKPSPLLTLNTEAFYRWQDQNVTAVNTDLRFAIREKLTVAIGQQYAQGGLLPQKGDTFNPFYLGDSQTVPQVSFITARLRAKISSRLTLATEALYNADTDHFAEKHYGLLYERQCWLIVLAYQELLNRNEFFATVSLKGLGETLPSKFSYLFNF